MTQRAGRCAQVRNNCCGGCDRYCSSGRRSAGRGGRWGERGRTGSGRGGRWGECGRTGSGTGRRQGACRCGRPRRGHRAGTGRRHRACRRGRPRRGHRAGTGRRHRACRRGRPRRQWRAGPVTVAVVVTGAPLTVPVTDPGGPAGYDPRAAAGDHGGQTPRHAPGHGPRARYLPAHGAGLAAIARTRSSCRPTSGRLCHGLLGSQA